MCLKPSSYREFTVSIVSKWLAEAATKTAGSYRDFKPDLEADLARSGISTAASVQVRDCNCTTCLCGMLSRHNLYCMVQAWRQEVRSTAMPIQSTVIYLWLGSVQHLSYDFWPQKSSEVSNQQRCIFAGLSIFIPGIIACLKLRNLNFALPPQ